MTQPDGAPGGPANSDAGGGGENGGGAVNLFTQAQVNSIAAAEKRGAISSYFKELGFDAPPSGDELKAAITAASSQKGDVERLTGERDTARAEAEKVPGLETSLLRARLAGDAGLKSRYWKYIEGDDEDSIKASIQEVLGDVRGGGSGDGSGDDGGNGGEQGQEQQRQSRQGTGARPPAPNQQQGSNSGGKPKTSMQAGREAYLAKHGKKE